MAKRHWEEPQYTGTVAAPAAPRDERSSANRLTGRITRLVAADEDRGLGAQVFFLPDDPAQVRNIDGKHRAASGELHVFADISGMKLGDECAVVYDPEEPLKPLKLDVALFPTEPTSSLSTDPVG
jgi:hypothetical protein